MARKKTQHSPDLSSFSDAHLLSHLEEKFAGRLRAAINVLQVIHEKTPLQDSDIMPALPHVNGVILSKILLRIVGLREAGESVDGQTVRALWSTATQLMDGLMTSSSSSLTPVSRVGEKVGRLHRHIAQKERQIAGQIQQAQQQIAQAHQKMGKS